MIATFETRHGITIKRAIAKLEQGTPMTAAELAEAIPCTKKHSNNVLAWLYAHKRIHIAGWKKRSTQGLYARVFGFGPGQDAPKPKPKPSKERTAAWRTSGGDPHLARRLKTMAGKIQRASTFAGMLIG